MSRTRINIRLTVASLALGILTVPAVTVGQDVTPPQTEMRLYDIIDDVSSARIEKDIRTLAAFGTRNTLSDTLSTTRGIGAARRWIKDEFDRISANCGGCLEVFFHRRLLEAGESSRIDRDVWIVNVIAIQRGSEHGNRYVMMSGDIDSRASDGLDGISDAPGANDNASGMAGTLEAARVLSKYQFTSSIIYAGLSGEEQGLFGGRFLAETATENEWDIVAVLNNDMIGNIEGVDGVVENNSFRIFSEATPVTDSERDVRRRRFYGGEVDGPSRQIARYVANLTDSYFTNLSPIMIYRLDRFGRGGHHRPFNDAGFPGVRIMETHENYNRQHQNIRVEDGISYGDVFEGVNFDYAAKLTAVNSVSLASIAWAPPGPKEVAIGGAVRASAVLQWKSPPHSSLAGFRVYWRETTAPQWTNSRFIGDVNEYTFQNLVIDNYLFGVASVDESGNESPISFPTALIPR